MLFMILILLCTDFTLIHASVMQAAQKFYTMLVLKKHQVLELQQNCSYDEILITRGNKFDNPCL